MLPHKTFPYWHEALKADLALAVENWAEALDLAETIMDQNAQERA